jgi:hypothetical protein
MNKAFRVIPILFFVLLALFWIAESYLSLGLIHYPACTVVILLIIQLIYNSRYMGLLYSVVFLVSSGYMLVSSIIDHFSTALPTDGTFRFMLIKSALFSTALLLAGVMLHHYFNVLKLNKP